MGMGSGSGKWSEVTTAMSFVCCWRIGSTSRYWHCRSQRWSRSTTSTARSLSSPSTQTQRHFTPDVLIVGSGGAGLSAALRCHLHGLRPLLVEKADTLGGTTAWSGGGLWVPNNNVHPRLRRREVKDKDSDDHDDEEKRALQYLDALVGDGMPASTPQRRLAFVRNAHRIIDDLALMGCRWIPTLGMPDYHGELQGSVSDGRSIEAALFDAKTLPGKARTLLRPPSPVFAGTPPMHIWEGTIATRVSSLHGLAMMAKIVLRWVGWKIAGRDPRGMGQALVGWLLKANLDRETEIWRGAAMKTLQVGADGAVTGATITRRNDQGKDEDVIVAPTTGTVVLCAGGFAKNDSMRRRYHSITAPTDVSWSSAVPEDTGEVIMSGIEDAGAATALMDEAWWIPTFIDPTTGVPFIGFGERGRPGTIIVDSQGKRFFNEAESYNDAGAHMRAREASGVSAIPAWLVADSSFPRRNPWVTVGPHIDQKTGIRTNFLYMAATLEELASKINVDGGGLVKTVERFNGFAHEGRDLDFARGETDMNRLSGDIGANGRKGLLNPCLGPLVKPPFFALRLYPGDLGTKGGLLTDEHARVLDKQGVPIKGLYAAGNTSASVMGTRYAGAGATIGPAIVFAALAVDHAAGKPWKV